MTKAQILTRLLSDISDEFDKTVGSFFYDAEKPVAIELEKAYGKIEDILLNGFALTAKGAYLDTKVSEQGLVRKSATNSYVKVLITGTPGSEVHKGDKVSSDALVFTITEDAVISDDNTVTVLAVCDTPGKEGNIPVGAINRFPVTLPGIVTVTNTESATGGFDEETDEELRDRYYEKVSLPATSGSKYHYVLWAREVDGVGDAKCIPLWNGNGTVKVVIINADKTVADEVLIGKVAQHIEENRPIGASVTVESATPLVLDISVSLVFVESADKESAKEKIQESITRYLQQNAFSGSYISYAQIGGCILGCDEVSDYSSLTINGGISNIEIAETEVPVLGVITYVDA